MNPGPRMACEQLRENSIFNFLGGVKLNPKMSNSLTNSLTESIILTQDLKLNLKLK